MSTKSYTKTRFSADDSALVMIDHQSGIMQLVHDYLAGEAAAQLRQKHVSD